MLKLFILQVFITLLLTLYFYFRLGIESAISSAIGGITCIVPGLFFMWIALIKQRRGPGASKKIVTQFYMGEAVKLVIMVVLFTVFLQWSKLKAMPMFVTFIASQMMVWFAPWLIRVKEKK